ncbi:MAG: pilin [Minisyncoccia bacterium]|jgi:hypothetical protein
MRVLHKLFAFAAIALYLLAPSAIVFAQTPPPTCQLYLNPTSISIGGSVTLSWTSTNATSGAITNVGNVGPSGSVNLLPSSAAYTTYVGSFTGPGGTANCSATVAVSAGSGGGSITGTDNIGTQNTILQNASANGTQNATLGSSNTTNTSAQTTAGSSGSNTNSNPSLVPCGYGAFSPSTDANGNPSVSATGCSACNLADLVQNIINFLIGLSIPIAAALFAWAGVLYFTSAENVGQRSKAKDIFKNAFIGFVIVITAWLVINTLLHVIFNQSQEFAGGNWFTIQCTAGTNRPNNASINGVLSTVLGTTGITTLSTTGGINGSQGPTSNTSGLNLNNLSQADQDTINEAVSDACVNSNQMDTASCAVDQTNNTILTQGAQAILNADCRNNPGGDSCQALNDASAAATASSISTAGIAAAAASYTGASTSAGPDGGNLACAWAVNNVLQSDGIAPIDGNSVPAMEAALQAGQGMLVSQSDAQAGDIVIEGNDGHVGICQNNGCTSVISNSSSNATFTWVSNTNFNSPYTSRIYQVNK